MDSFYTLEKLTYVKHALDTYPGPVKDRLKEAMKDFVALTSREIPKRAQSDFESIRQRLTATKPVGDEGSFYASIDAMSEVEANKVAQDLIDLLSKLE